MGQHGEVTLQVAPHGTRQAYNGEPSPSAGDGGSGGAGGRYIRTARCSARRCPRTTSPAAAAPRMNPTSMPRSSGHSSASGIRRATSSAMVLIPIQLSMRLRRTPTGRTQDCSWEGIALPHPPRLGKPGFPSPLAEGLCSPQAPRRGYAAHERDETRLFLGRRSPSGGEGWRAWGPPRTGRFSFPARGRARWGRLAWLPGRRGRRSRKAAPPRAPPPPTSRDITHTSWARVTTAAV